MNTIMDTLPFVTPGVEKPDLANGPYLSFNADNGAIAYIQMTNDRTIWIKQVGSDGKLLNIATFGVSSGEPITNYLVQRLKETEPNLKNE